MKGYGYLNGIVCEKKELVKTITKSDHNTEDLKKKMEISHAHTLIRPQPYLEI